MLPHLFGVLAYLIGKDWLCQARFFKMRGVFQAQIIPINGINMMPCACAFRCKNPGVWPGFGGWGWIRTTEVVDGRFTVCSL